MKYKIKRDQQPFTEGELASARNFNTVVKGYKAMKIPFYRSGKFLTRGSAIIVAAALALIVIFDDKADTPVRDFISPPIVQANIPMDSFVVDADSSAEIVYKTGSKLHVPTNAFKDASGKLIKGKVDIHYREFHDQKDIFLSGIPMTYDSAGKTYTFESAGMMEITASQNGKVLTTNTDKPIKVDMVSNTAEDRYNTYYLDTTSKKWVNLNQANLVPQSNQKMQSSDTMSVESDDPNPAIAKCEQEVKKAEDLIKTVEKQKPMPVIKADKNKTEFHIVVDDGEFPEIGMYKEVHFQVKDEKDFNAASARIQWEDVKLKKLSGMDYEVTFSKAGKTFKVIATPVIDDKDMPAAKKIYDQKFADYETKLTERKAGEEKAKQELKRIMADERLRDSVYESHMSKLNLIYRTFSINQFGFYNCDCPRIIPADADVIAEITDENSKPLNLPQMSLVEKNVNMVCSYHSVNKECLHFKFNSKENNIIWGVTADNKLAIIDVKSFKAQQATSGTVQFKFRIIDKDFKSSDEVKKYLEI